MSPVGTSTPSEGAQLLEEIDDLRRRVRARHREHALWAVLIGLVALGGALAFLFSPQIREVSCEPFDGGAGMVCGQGEGLFLLWWYWPLAAAAAVGLAFARRHRRGTWRMSSVGWVVLTIVGVFALPTAVTLLGVVAPPVTYPMAAATALAGVARSRRSGLGVGIALAAVAGVVVVELALSDMTGVPQSLLRNNLGWALSSLTVALAALLCAVLWTVRDRR